MPEEFMLERSVVVAHVVVAQHLHRVEDLGPLGEPKTEKLGAELTSIWMLLAPIDELEEAEPVLLAGPGTGMHRVVRVFPRKDAAVVLLRRGMDEVAALRVDATGEAQPIPLPLQAPE
jgi:hypothetical protein